jgi:hypothetical protein
MSRMGASPNRRHEPADDGDERVPRTAEGIAAALTPARRTEFHRELGTAPPDKREAVLRRWWCEAMLDTDPEGDRITAAALDGTLPLVRVASVVARRA